MDDDELDLGEAADYILGERPRLQEAVVWAVLNELQDPPAAGSEPLALVLLSSTHPEIPARQARAVIGEWQNYARLAQEPDWDDDD